MSSAKITTKFNLYDVLTFPWLYVTEETDVEILSLPDEDAEGGVLKFMVGVENGDWYIVVEDEYSSDDIYQDETEETLMHTFIRALNDNLMRI